MNNCERYIKGKEPRDEPRDEKMNEIFDRATEEIKKIKMIKARLEYFNRAYKRLDLTFDLGMSLILIANILFFIWNKSYITALSIGFVSGLWLANYMYRGLRRI